MKDININFENKDDENEPIFSPKPGDNVDISFLTTSNQWTKRKILAITKKQVFVYDDNYYQIAVIPNNNNIIFKYRADSPRLSEFINKQTNKQINKKGLKNERFKY